MHVRAPPHVPLGIRIAPCRLAPTPMRAIGLEMANWGTDLTAVLSSGMRAPMWNLKDGFGLQSSVGVVIVVIVARGIQPRNDGGSHKSPDLKSERVLAPRLEADLLVARA